MVALSLTLRVTSSYADPPAAAPPSDAPAQASPPPPGPPPPMGAPPPGAPYYYYYPAQAPATLPYRADAPVPAGYRLEEKTRTGFIIAGSIVIGVPYVIGLSAVSTRDSNNGANWLLVPVLGPWIAIGARRKACTPSNTNNTTTTTTTTDNGLDCLGDAFATMALVFDGLIQATGATLLVVGLAVPKKVLVRQDMAHVFVTRIGSGYGVATEGTF